MAEEPEVLAALDFEPEGILDEGPVDITAVLLRRLTWDTMPCDEVADLLPALGLTQGTEEGMNHDHAESHHRTAQVYPIEVYFRRLADILGVIMATAMTQRAGVDLGEESVKFAEQNAEVILAGSRAIVAQLVDTGVLTYGPQVRFIQVGSDGE